jgi:hypothetical protein
MLKSYQSVADKIRGEYSQKIKDLEAKIEVQEPKNQVVEEPKDDVAKISEVVKSALASSELLKNMQEQFAALQAEKDATTKLNNAKAKFDKDDWANSNKQIANIAWKQAIKRYEDKGKKMTEDELFAEAKSNLTDLFSLKGMDATKPFESEGAGDSFDATEFEKIYVANGRIPKKDN